MSPKHLHSYKGKLNYKQIVDGMNVANRNAIRLVEDSQILFDAKRYASAASLAILSIEESGKKGVLRRLALAINDEEISSVWKDYRTHTKKNILWLMPQLIAEGARRLDDFGSLFINEAEHPYILDQVKQISFYTDCLGKAHWSEPSLVVDEKLAAFLIRIAKMLISDRETEEKEIELWVKHMGPVKGNNYGAQKEALLHWFAELKELGLLPKGTNIFDLLDWLGLDINK